MSGDPMCPLGGVCMLACIGDCCRMPRTVVLTGGSVFSVPYPGVAELHAENQQSISERAELRSDVMALWQQLGDVLSIFSGSEMLSAEQQDKLRRARALHALWSETPDPTNGG